MKNATKHADLLKSLHKKLVKEHQPQPKTSIEPLHALVRGAMSFDVTDARAEEAMNLIDREFVDLNELRVATDLEIQELLGTRYPKIEQRVAMITLSLNMIFEKEHTLSLERLKSIPKRDARAFLRELPEIHPFVEAYILLFGLDAPAVPMDDAIIGLLRDNNIFVDAISPVEAQKFVEYHLKVDEYYDFYHGARRATGDDSRKKKPAKA